MPQSTFDEIKEKYVEMSVTHPFREGNGRRTRIWLDLMLKKEIGYIVDWSKVEKEDYLLAMERSLIKDIEIKFLLKNALTDNVNDRKNYMNGIEQLEKYTERMAGSYIRRMYSKEYMKIYHSRPYIYRIIFQSNMKYVLRL